MKIIFFKKRNLFNIITILVLLILTALLIFPMNSTKTLEAFSPININEDLTIDLNGDGVKDKLEVVEDSKNSTTDVKISTNTDTYFLSQLCTNNILCSKKFYFPIKIYLSDLSRNNIPDIIIQGVKDNSSITYIFSFKDKTLNKIYECNKNIFGIIDYEKNKTPQCNSLNSSSGLSSLDAFMLSNGNKIDISKDIQNINDISTIQAFIDIIQTDYELDEIPDIFTENISENDLSALWTLDKENNNYSFQDAFFKDQSFNDKDEIASVKWTLSFEKFNKEKGDDYKTEMIATVLTERTYNNNYKISSFYIK